MSSLIGSGPRQYFLASEDYRSFDGLKAAFDQELRPADAIERMWADEIVDLEWDLHRLRLTRRTIVENSLVERLTHRVAMMNAVSPIEHAPAQERSLEERATLAAIRYQARKCVQGDPGVHQFIHDAVIARLYSRRDLIADGRVTSGRRR